MKRQRVGSDFNEFLRQEGLLAVCEASALKRVTIRCRNQKLMEDMDDLKVIAQRRTEPVIPHEALKKSIKNTGRSPAI